MGMLLDVLRLFRRSLLRAAVLISIFLLHILPVSAASFSLTYDEVNDLIGSSLEGLEIRLNNLGDFNGRTHARKNSSYIRFKGQSISSFSVDPYQAYRFLGRTHTYYVSDIKSSTVSISAQDKSFYLSLDFELQGSELEARCVMKSGRRSYKECTSFLPDVDFTEARVVARLRPIAHKGSISFYVSSAKIVGDVSIGYCRSWFFGFFCTEFVKIPQRTAKLRTQLATKLKSFVNSPRMRDRIAADFKSKVLGNIATVSSIKLGDDAIVVSGRLRRR